MLRLARELEGRGRSVLVTTTTHLFDPRREPGGPAGRLVFRPEMEFPCAGDAGVAGLAGVDAGPGHHAARLARGGRAGQGQGDPPVLDSGSEAVVGLRPRRGRRVETAPVEGPGRPTSRSSLRAPTSSSASSGLDGLGRPMDGRTVHRPERFAARHGLRARLSDRVGAPRGPRAAPAKASSRGRRRPGSSSSTRSTRRRSCRRAISSPGSTWNGSSSAVSKASRPSPSSGGRSRRRAADPRPARRRERRRRPRDGVHRPPRPRGLPGRGARARPARARSGGR